MGYLLKLSSLEFDQIVLWTVISWSNFTSGFIKKIPPLLQREKVGDLEVVSGEVREVASIISQLCHHSPK